MSTHQNSNSQYQNHQRATELQDLPAHAHRVAEQQGKKDHQTATEQSRHSSEHSADHAHPQAATVGHGIPAFGHNDIAALAHVLWEQRGKPEGSPEKDWFEAAEQLRSRAASGISPHPSPAKS